MIPESRKNIRKENLSKAPAIFELTDQIKVKECKESREEDGTTL